MITLFTTHSILKKKIGVLIPPIKKKNGLICSYFTKLIFETVKVPYEENLQDPNEDPDGEISLTEIMKTIIEGKNAETDLLCIFCGADI